jgi:hypothetical protein
MAAHLADLGIDFPNHTASRLALRRSCEILANRAYP